ncbi:hypothetical protein [Streptomyces sp. Go-475]|uniref:MGH1-like glycoside hydrolase domain-containing protein n=1 Tax=Streptomyces sp. Go-475 TaxID=2072505 RepID=UPI001E609088|nr:hypothetical protein [Streptomyces sp. Go-475]
MDRIAQLTTRPAGREIAYDPAAAPPPLQVRAAQVLEANWTGKSTVPSRSLYPHQWSWDSAFIAIGLRHLSPLRAQTELETLFAAQWADGRIPHIVFNPSVPLDAYFPSPDFWRSSTAGSAAGAPRTVQTSGIVQPPVHALAAWLVHLADPGLSRARGFLARAYPRLAAWHRYLLRRRDLGGGGLVSVVHPWEQGMDNSPCWDRPLSRVTPAPARSFRRADLDHGAPEDRPTDLDYGRYVRLAADYRDGGYADEPYREATAESGAGGSAGSRAGGSAGRRAGGFTDSRPGGSADSGPSGSAGSGAGGFTDSRPSGSADSRPSGSAGSGAGGFTDSRPSGSAGSGAGGFTDSGPGGSVGSRAGGFAVEDPAFNALLIASEYALARIAHELGAAEPRPGRRGPSASRRPWWSGCGTRPRGCSCAGTCAPGS